MPITAAQANQAERRQWAAARESAPQVRLVAGPGTGKSKTIEKRVAFVLENRANPLNVYAISFTVASATDLRLRIARFCANRACAQAAGQVRVSTMHSLALRILRSANLLATLYPDDPVVLDDWEQGAIYDLEFAAAAGCTPKRASQIRLAHDAAWQTLDAQSVAQAAITPTEVNAFNINHPRCGNLYSCVLPGELIYRCVDAIRMGQIQDAQLPQIEHLIVDEFQDLNACDQQFIEQLSSRGAILFVGGDDDQSVYSFRHADPSGLVGFGNRYPQSVTHVLDDCFRCTPNVLIPAATMIATNPNRLLKNPVSLYANANPPVFGTMDVWSFGTQEEEALAIAESCQALIRAGLNGREDQIIILVSDRSLQLGPITQALGNLGLAYHPPPGDSLTEGEALRAVFCVLRILKDRSEGKPDYVAHRALLGLLAGVGAGTARAIGDACVANNQNFRDLFYLAQSPPWLTGRNAAAVARVIAVVNEIAPWTVGDTVGARRGNMRQVLESVFTGSTQLADYVATWNGLSDSLPFEMTLNELCSFLAATNDADRRAILDVVRERVGELGPNEVAEKRIRILTMHGAKGLSGRVVFIPSAEQGIMPSFKAIRATGLLIEHRRLFYVSVTRAMAACIVSHCARHTGATAFRLQQRAIVRLPRSQFLNEMQVGSRNRTGGLTQAEAVRIVQDIDDLE
jgi:DNA helicase-2/ATP-dependent DNA helicase PcrA